MTERNLPANSYAYSIDDPDLSSLLDQLLEALEPYEHRDLLREFFVTGIKLAQENCSRGDLKILRTSVKELRYAFRVFSRFRGTPKATIFGSARCRPQEAEYQSAVQMGRRLAESGFMVITGAGPGIMEAGNVGAGRERSFGLNISLPFEQEPNRILRGDPKLINFWFFFTRKLFFVKESDAIVVMPGGFGTLDEGFEVLTLLQTGRNQPTPVVLLDAPGGTYWKDWLGWLRGQLLSRSYISPDDEALFFPTDNVEEAIQEIQTFYRRYHSSRYVEGKSKLVLRLKEVPEPELVRRLNLDFRDLLVEGEIKVGEAFPEENDEPEVWNLPRLVLAFNQRKFGRLRQLIDAINYFPDLRKGSSRPG